jgi:transcriptional regulator with XRE-family HTH domain
MAKQPEFDVDDPDEALAELRKDRLVKLLDVLDKKGISQSEVARRTGVPPQYLNDVKSRRRSLSERFARRLQDEFQVNYQWLLGSHGSMEMQRLDQGTGPADARRLWLPVFAHPISGDPFTVPDWDGSSVEIAGVAAMRVLQADRPYAHRFGAKDRRGRLCSGDLLLVSQAGNVNADIHVIRMGRKCHLARRKDSGEWECLNPDISISGEPTVIGHGLGIIWGAL